MTRPRSTITTLTSKGQITVPAWIARRLGLRQGDQLDVSVLDEDGFSAVRKRPGVGARA